jgi:hypothetical protein
MFKIIGGDGRQYGPVSADQIRQWIAEGRANAQTLVQAEGSVEWKPLGHYPEFASPPVSAAMAPTPPAPPAAPATRPVTNSMAVAGLVFGLIGLLGGWLCCGPILSVLGIVFSSVGLSQINRDPTRQTGRAIAIAGLILSIVALIALLIFGVRLGMWRPWRRHYMYWRQWPT